MLEHDGSMYVPLDKLLNEEEMNEEDKVVYHMSSEEYDRIQELISEYDVRPAFDEKKCREEFRSIQEMAEKDTIDRLPHDLYQQIADVRVFSLGYCTKEILCQLKGLSKENEKKMNRIISEYTKAQQKENIPQTLRERFGFHDCEVIEFTVSKKDVVMHLDTRGGLNDFTMITFATSEIIRQEGHIVGSTWLYEELYRIENGYEAHMLFAGEGMPELIIRCYNIIVEEK